ncbi:formate dehydrogenase [Burkholderia sp. WAC0059]|uniref:FdhF/YdeP family oxidoreductase n=1 Tax=Burkholderia sp. WAC0059 TaxID=2066022 RepID=UPI000C7EEC03|nr:FdhF/YdeP family oxidoreductase [Burkholderia sp. WAC0059]PLZ02172.1 formate dehydrogenase [Burkholderia sp. WAC0059]
MADNKERIARYDGPAGGWGSAKAVAGILMQEHVVLHGTKLLTKQNKPDGFQCVSCSWAKPGEPHLFEFCENGAKATAWEVTARRAPPEFFAEHTCSELETWSDFHLEGQGRLTEPMRWDAATDRYVPVTWESAFDEIGRELNQLPPNDAVFYASGRASLETSYMYQLFTRMYGTNNLPDSSNMCHETTSVALPPAIGVAVGTVTLEDFEHTDCILYLGHNVGTNAPRMLHPLQAARKRGVPLIAFNPVREPGLVKFVNPQSPMEMLTPMAATAMNSQFVQLKIGGDSAVLAGMCKHVLDEDEKARQAGTGRVIDVDFIAEHTRGFEAFRDSVRQAAWEEIELVSGVSRAEIGQAARTYMHARAAMAFYGMGLTQHRKGVHNIQMLTNLLLLKGNMGRPGAGICPVRGHSNVQGQRTVGITEKPELVPLDQLKKQYGFEPPRDKGLDTVQTCEAVIQGRVKAFVMLGGNFVRAVPDTGQVEPAWRRLRLTVNVVTKFNRSCLMHGEVSYVLPCRGRIEIDRQATGEQAVSIEDSTGCYHGSRGFHEPASEHLLSEPAIVAGLAKATLKGKSAVDWDAWVGNYGLVRDAIAQTYPEIFANFNRRLWEPGGFHRPIAARERKWNTANGKANFFAVSSLRENPDMPETSDSRVVQLMTTRGDSQFNTTVYGLDDRFRGVWGTRSVLLMNRSDMAKLGVEEGALLRAETIAHDGIVRTVAGLRATGFDIPAGCAAGYYPELNVLVPVWHCAEGSHVPATKSIPIRVLRDE